MFTCLLLNLALQTERMDANFLFLPT